MPKQEIQEEMWKCQKQGEDYPTNTNKTRSITPIKSLMRLLVLVLIVFSSVICSSVPVKKKSSDPWLDVSLKEDIGMRHPKL